MITNLQTSLFLVLLMNSIYKISNPLKLSLNLTLLSSLLFLKMYSKTSSSWYPLLFLLIFMGGIMMMFMVLSSMNPNEKNKKMNWIWLWPMMILPTETLKMEKIELNLFQITNNCKTILESNNSFSLLTLTLITYFFISMKLCSSKTITLRKTNCWKNMIL